MLPMFVEFLPRGAGETEEAVRQLLLDDIMRLNGKQTIYQMIQLAKRIRERGGQPQDPLNYVARYFGPHIYGAQDNYKDFSKKLVIERLLRENNISGEQLLAYGDGYVEIQNTKEVGGLAVAVASDEAHNGSGHMDEWKRQRLLGVGADVVIPDFRDAIRILDLTTEG